MTIGSARQELAASCYCNCVMGFCRFYADRVKLCAYRGVSWVSRLSKGFKYLFLSYKKYFINLRFAPDIHLLTTVQSLI